MGIKFFILFVVLHISISVESKIISREEWVAQPPTGEIGNLSSPIEKVIIIHTATESCETQAQCSFRTRFIQTFHIESRSFSDIAYNFLVGGDGNIYFGRGWDKVGAHTKGHNNETIGFAFIGTFVNETPSDVQLEAAKAFLDDGVKNGKLTENYQLYGHRDFINSESPGEQLYNIIKTWPNFAQNGISSTKSQVKIV